MLTVRCHHCPAVLDGLAEYDAHARAEHDRPTYRRMNRESRAIYAATLTDDRGWITTRNGSDVHLWPTETAARFYVDTHASASVR